MVYRNVKIGKNVVLEPGVIIGLPPHNKKDGELKTIIGNNAIIRINTVIVAGVKIGDNFQTGPGVFIREDNKIGNNVNIWANTVLNPRNKIGNNTTIHVNCFLEDCRIGNYVFIAPHVMFANDFHPTNPPLRQHMKGATVGDNAVIGANSTILPYVKIGTKAMIGAGSVVTKNVEGGKLAYGNPAKTIKPITDIMCNKSGLKHYPYREFYK
jgi:acetyltransferase-like isoleucine patch superfamily enzyme